MCNELYDHRDWPEKFLDLGESESANRVSERLMRHAMIGRKLPFGTHSTASGRSVKTILTIIGS